MNRPDEPVAVHARADAGVADQLRDVVLQHARADAGGMPAEEYKRMVDQHGILEKQMDLVMREMRNIERKAKRSLDDLNHKIVVPVVEQLLAYVAATDIPPAASLASRIQARVAQEPAQTPHCMHILTMWPSSTLASTSLRKLFR